VVAVGARKTIVVLALLELVVLVVVVTEVILFLDHLAEPPKTVMLLALVVAVLAATVGFLALVSKAQFLLNIRFKYVIHRKRTNLGRIFNGHI
jgi:hypothetical protein